MILTEKSPVSSTPATKSESRIGTQPLPALPNPPAPLPDTSLRCFPASLPVLIGLDEAIVLSQMHYWMLNPKAGYYHHGRKWIYNGYKEWLLQFPWLKTPRRVGIVIRSLETQGLVISDNYNHNAYDRRKHYTLDYETIYRKTGWNPRNLSISDFKTMDSSSSNDPMSDFETFIYTNFPQKNPQKTNNNAVTLFENISDEQSGLFGTTTVTLMRFGFELGNVEFSTKKSAVFPLETALLTVDPEATRKPEAEEPEGNLVGGAIDTLSPRSLPERGVEPIRSDSPEREGEEKAAVSPPVIGSQSVLSDSNHRTENSDEVVKPQKPKVVKKADNPEAGAITQSLEEAGLLNAKLKELALTLSLEDVRKALMMLKKKGDEVLNPAGWLTKCLRGRWWKSNQPQKAPPAKPWEAEFAPWYAWAIASDIVEDVPVRHLATDHRGEPIVRLAQPDRFTRAPYTCESWRKAMEQFPMPEEAKETSVGVDRRFVQPGATEP